MLGSGIRCTARAYANLPPFASHPGCLLGVWASAAPYGTSPTCLNPVPSHSHRTLAHRSLRAVARCVRLSSTQGCPASNLARHTIRAGLAGNVTRLWTETRSRSTGTRSARKLLPSEKTLRCNVGHAYPREREFVTRRAQRAHMGTLSYSIIAISLQTSRSCQRAICMGLDTLAAPRSDGAGRGKMSRAGP